VAEVVAEVEWIDAADARKGESLLRFEPRMLVDDPEPQRVCLAPERSLFDEAGTSRSVTGP